MFQHVFVPIFLAVTLASCVVERSLGASDEQCFVYVGVGEACAMGAEEADESYGANHCDIPEDELPPACGFMAPRCEYVSDPSGPVCTDYCSSESPCITGTCNNNKCVP